MITWLRRCSTYLPLGFVLALPTLAMAAEEESKAPAAKVSMFGMILGAGPPEYLLILFSMISFAVALQNFMFIKKEAIIPDGLGDDLHNLLSKDGPTEEAVEQARAMVDNDPSMTGKVLAAALGVHDLGYDAMREAAEDVTITETTRWMQKPGCSHCSPTWPPCWDCSVRCGASSRRSWTWRPIRRASTSPSCRQPSASR